MSLQLVTAAAASALSWEDDVKSHLRLDSDEEQPRVTTLVIPAATEWAEGFTNRALITQTWKLKLDHFPGSCWSGCSTYGQQCCSLAYHPYVGAGPIPIEIPKPPLQSITHIKYYDTDGVLQTWASNLYQIDPTIASPAVFDPMCQPYRVWPVYGQSYPTARAQRNAVEIQFVCGYGDASTDVPAKLRAAMLLSCGEQFERRQESQVGNIVQEFKQTAERLAWPFRVRLFAEAA